MTFEPFFGHVTGRKPFPYQTRLGTEPWPTLLDVPTGLGKTAAVIVAWLYKRLRGDPETGTRLVYCLPMRALVQQTEAAARNWCSSAETHFAQREIRTPTVHVLMGGDIDKAWDNHPEQPALVIGTQDMLLSRALNRGFALSPYKWPLHFSLLNNDCLWIFDETQLMGVGVETGAQLQGFREKLGAHAAARTVWMSATLGERQLNTVDHRTPQDGWPTHVLGADDLKESLVQKRIRASKPIRKLEGIRLDEDSEKKSYPEALTKRLLSEHAARGGLTLVIVNRVARAQAIYRALCQTEGRTEHNTALVHSRFRATDRRRHEAILQDTTTARVVVATQAVEAGVDVSARTMFTELAPWPSLVQRFGRSNRYGEDDAVIYWVDIDTESPKSVLSLPYDAGELDQARDLLARVTTNGGDAGPQSLREIDYQAPSVVRPVVRRRDLLDLFDTTPDLSGNDIDISRYVRDGQDTDVQVYWREFDGPEPSNELGRPVRDELCRVSISAVRGYLSNLAKYRKKVASGSQRDKLQPPQLQAWLWNPLEKRWEASSRPYPGRILLLHASAGGYESRLGWTGEVGAKIHVPSVPGEPRGRADDESYGGDPDSLLKRWVLLSDHLEHVQAEAAVLASAAGLGVFANALTTAGLWHDVGKAHEVFQNKLLAPLEARPDLKPAGKGPWAKSNHRLRSSQHRKYFRHELASALAWLAAGDEDDPEMRDLVAYLVAAHHGKVRVSLRSLPGETAPNDPAQLFARGVWDGDVLPPFELPDGRRFNGVELDLSLMQLGKGSWLARTLALRDAEHLGPFRLALLESIVRIADWRASRKEEEGAYDA